MFIMLKYLLEIQDMIGLILFQVKVKIVFGQGYIPYDDLPQILNPNDGFFQNCNSSPYLATGNRVDIPKILPDWTGIEDHQTNRALRSLETFGLQSTITRDDFFNFKYDVEYSRESVIAYVRDKYLNDMKNSDQSSLYAALELLRKWDLRADSLNTSAAIALLALPKSFKMEELTYDKDEVTKKLYESIDYLNENFGKNQCPTGKSY